MPSGREFDLYQDKLIVFISNSAAYKSRFYLKKNLMALNSDT